MLNISICYPSVQVLQAMGLYYIFTTQQAGESARYQSFPNTNLCLSIYKANTIERRLSRTENHCFIQPGTTVHSRLWGFHKKPFDVVVDGAMDQVSIIFAAGSLRRFTAIPYADLLPETTVAELLFGRLSNALNDQLFSTDSLVERTKVLDALLLQALNNRQPERAIHRFLAHLDLHPSDTRVVSLAAAEHKDSSTLYRHFKQYVGQAPKEYLKVVRFRRALRALQQKRYHSLTGLAHDLGYYDQSHFIKDFTLFTDFNPGLIHQVTTVIQEELVLAPAAKNA